jgi:hypothetical protein
LALQAEPDAAFPKFARAKIQLENVEAKGASGLDRSSHVEFTEFWQRISYRLTAWRVVSDS